MGSLPQNSPGISAIEVLESALQEQYQAYTDSNPLSAKAYKNACNYLPGGNTRTALYTTPFPFTIASGYGCTLKTFDGHEIIDFLGDHTAGIYGHNNPVIRKVSQV